MRIKKRALPTIEIIVLFWSAPDNALFDQKDLSAVLGLSEKWFEMGRWKGGGIPFLRVGGRIRYKKSAVLEFLEKGGCLDSTSQYGEGKHVA